MSSSLDHIPAVREAREAKRRIFARWKQSGYKNERLYRLYMQASDEETKARERALRGAPSRPRRHKASPGHCRTCDAEREAGSDFHPPHDASTRCESGGHDHCSCGVCF